MTRRQQAFEFFIHQGWTPAQSAGIVANLEAESALRPDAVGDGGQAYGIAQWHPPRQAGFEALIGKPIRGSSFEDQLYWVHAELRGAEKRAGDALAACTTAAAAAEVVCRKYERPADPDGDSRKRAALAEIIFSELVAAPDAPILTDDVIPPVAPVFTVSLPAPEAPMLPILTTLLPMVLGMFAPKVQAVITKATGNPAAADMLAPFLSDLFSKIGQTTGVVPPGQPVTSDAQAVAAVAELQKLRTTNAALVQQIEAHALDYLDKLAPMFDRLERIEKEQWSAEEESRAVAAQRSMQGYDNGPLLTRFAIYGTLVATLMVGALLGIQIWFSDTHEARGDLLILFVTMVTWVLSKAGTLFDYRYGTSRSSAAKDSVIGTIAKVR